MSRRCSKQPRRSHTSLILNRLRYRDAGKSAAHTDPTQPDPSPHLSERRGYGNRSGISPADAEGLGRRRRQRQLLRPAKHGLLSAARVHTLSPRHPARRPTCGPGPQPLTQRGAEEDGRGPRWGRAALRLRQLVTSRVTAPAPRGTPPEPRPGVGAPRPSPLSPGWGRNLDVEAELRGEFEKSFCYPP